MDGDAPAVVFVEFPIAASYPQCLGRLRTVIKPHIKHLAIRKRLGGAEISGPRGKLLAAILILPHQFRFQEVEIVR